MWAIERDVERLGGIARRTELLDAGHAPEMIDLLLRYRSKLVVVRRGWYTTPAIAESAGDVLTAWKAGGRLACISAAVFHGVVPAVAGPVHVTVARNSSRRAKVEGTLLHWDDVTSPAEYFGRARRAVSAERALEQMRVCRAVDAPWPSADR